MLSRIVINVYNVKESRRRRQMEAAEKRRRENENRGIKDVERLRRQQQHQLDIERRQEEAMAQNNQSSNLKVYYKINNMHQCSFYFLTNEKCKFFSGKPTPKHVRFPVLFIRSEVASTLL